MRAPPELRFVLATRRRPGPGLHRLRLEGELAEIRAADPASRSARRGSCSRRPASSCPGRAGGAAWAHRGLAAGLRLAALSLAGTRTRRGVAGFSGSERTWPSTFLAQLLQRQPRQVRRLLLRTSILERVNGELADLLTARSAGGGSCRSSSGRARSWSRWTAAVLVRYHRLFADLLRFELQAAEPDELPALHTAAAAGWLARVRGRGDPARSGGW